MLLIKTDDMIWVVILATAPATAILSCSSESALVSCDVKAGITKLKYDMVLGEAMKAQVIRDGNVVAECAPTHEEFHFEEKPEVYNFNAYVAMS